MGVATTNKCTHGNQYVDAMRWRCKDSMTAMRCDAMPFAPDVRCDVMRFVHTAFAQHRRCDAMPMSEVGDVLRTAANAVTM